MNLLRIGIRNRHSEVGFAGDHLRGYSLRNSHRQLKALMSDIDGIYRIRCLRKLAVLLAFEGPCSHCGAIP
jgi:hypothetical protein